MKRKKGKELGKLGKSKRRGLRKLSKSPPTEQVPGG